MVAETFTFAADAIGTVQSPVTLTISDPTDINAIEAEDGNEGNFYNIAGQRLDRINRSGVYIIGNKKVVKK